MIGAVTSGEPSTRHNFYSFSVDRFTFCSVLESRSLNSLNVVDYRRNKSSITPSVSHQVVHL